jgi:3-deoxy-manno-octulosonate cytidylyltransferase (CMP-KDO synthetase)
MTDFVVVIPARYASTRLPGKPLREINGKSMIEHVYRRGRESGARDVVIATDDQRIAEAAESFGATVCMTGDQHRSGTERIAEVTDLLDWHDDTIIINLQGDEPAMPPELIDQCATLLDESAADIATLASPILSDEDFGNPNVVKVIRNNNGFAIYFSRATVPYPRDAARLAEARSAALHHHGIYAYRCSVLRSLMASEPSALELAEHLEQLRALSLGMTIRVDIPAVRPGTGVDTEDDLAAAALELAERL